MFGWLVTKMLPAVPKSVVRRVAQRYVAGENLDAATRTVKALNERGFLATLDILGEDAKDAAHADGTVDGYCGVLDRIHAAGLGSNISVKLTHLGLRDDRGAAEARLRRILDRARALDNFVRIDMEDSALTSTTLEIHDMARQYYPRTGTVIQAYLRRTLDDARKLAESGANLRLCKGIYREPREIAFQKREEIRESYLATAEVLLQGNGTYTGFATHDQVLLQRLLDLVQRLDVPRDRFEFQALLGVPVEDLLAGYVQQGFRVRWYVPFGEEWYAYSTRRLKENPNLASYIVRQMFGRRRIGAEAL